MATILTFDSPAQILPDSDHQAQSGSPHTEQMMNGTPAPHVLAEGLINAAAGLYHLLLAPEKLGDLYQTFYLTPGATGALESVTAASPAEQIQFIRESFDLSMTRLAQILGKTRPTIYSWLRDNTAPPAALAKLQTLARAAAHWKEEGGEPSRSYLLDYRGLDGEGTTLIEEMSGSPKGEDLIKLINQRMREADEGEIYARKVLGEQDMQTPEISEIERQRNEAWNSLNRQFSWNR